MLEPDRRLTLEDILAHDFLQPIEKLEVLLPKYTVAIPPQSSKKQRQFHPLITLEQQLSTEELHD